MMCVSGVSVAHPHVPRGGEGQGWQSPWGPASLV